MNDRWLTVWLNDTNVGDGSPVPPFKCWAYRDGKPVPYRIFIYQTKKYHSQVTRLLPIYQADILSKNFFKSTICYDTALFMLFVLKLL